MSGLDEARGIFEGMFNVDPKRREVKAMSKPRGNEYEILKMVCQGCGAYVALTPQNSSIGWVLDVPILIAQCGCCNSKHCLALDPSGIDICADSNDGDLQRQAADFYDDIMPAETDQTPDKTESALCEKNIADPDSYLRS